MSGAASRLGGMTWSLTRARITAREIERVPRDVHQLVRVLFEDDVELRKRAADVARRITEANPTPLHPYADQLAGLLPELPAEESRTRWHLGLVVPRIAHTREQRRRAARLMMLLAEDPGNVVRCSAVEGLGTLALAESSLLESAEEMIERFLSSGTLANRSRARTVERQLRRRYPISER